MEVSFADVVVPVIRSTMLSGAMFSEIYTLISAHSSHVHNPTEPFSLDMNGLSKKLGSIGSVGGARSVIAVSRHNLNSLNT